MSDEGRVDQVPGRLATSVRGGVADVGGLTPLMKVAHLAESFGMRMEVHGAGRAICTRCVRWAFRASTTSAG